MQTSYFWGDILFFPLSYVQETLEIQYWLFNGCKKLINKYGLYIRKIVTWYRTYNTASLCLSGFPILHINTVDCQSGNEMWCEPSIHIHDILKTSEGACQTFILHVCLKYCRMLSWRVIATILFGKGDVLFFFHLKQFYNADKVNPPSL